MARRSRKSRRRSSCPKGSRYIVRKRGHKPVCTKTKKAAVRERKAMGKGARVTKR